MPNPNPNYTISPKPNLSRNPNLNRNLEAAARDLLELITFSLNTPLSQLLVRSQLLAAHAMALWETAGSPTTIAGLTALDLSLARLFGLYGGVAAGHQGNTNSSGSPSSIQLSAVNLGLPG